MRQALHIFNNDVRHLRWEIALALALTAVFTSSDIAANQKLTSDQDQLVKALLPLSWIYLIGRVIHTEALPGDKQFWLTRPYSRKSLFAAKVLFLLTFITLPMMVSDSLIVGMSGFSPAAHLPGLLWEQALRWMVLIGPAAAVATITTGVAEQAGSILLALAFFLCMMQLDLNGFSDWGVRDWIRTSITCGFAGAGAAAIILWQYFWRRTMLARIAAGGLVGLGSLIAFLPQLGGRHIDAAPVSVSLDRSIPLGTGKPVGSFVPQADLPLRVAGVPEGLTPWVEGSVSIIPFPGTYQGFSGPWQVRWEIVDGSGVRQLMMMNRSFFDQIKDSPVRIHTSLTLTLVRDRRTTELSHTQATMVPGVGLCSTLLICLSPYRTPRVLVSDNWHGPQPAFTSSSPFPAEFGISPIVALYPDTRQASPPPDGITVTTAEPVTRLYLNFDIDNVRLADFEVH
jgi:hypothetical protein